MKIIGNYKEKLVLGMLSNVPFDGLQWEALYRAAEDLKIYKTLPRFQEKRGQFGDARF